MPKRGKNDAVELEICRLGKSKNVWESSGDEEVEEKESVDCVFIGFFSPFDEIEKL